MEGEAQRRRRPGLPGVARGSRLTVTLVVRLAKALSLQGDESIPPARIAQSSMRPGSAGESQARGEGRPAVGRVPRDGGGGLGSRRRQLHHSGQGEADAGGEECGGLGQGEGLESRHMSGWHSPRARLSRVITARRHRSLQHQLLSLSSLSALLHLQIRATFPASLQCADNLEYTDVFPKTSGKVQCHNDSVLSQTKRRTDDPRDLGRSSSEFTAAAAVSFMRCTCILLTVCPLSLNVAAPAGGCRPVPERALRRRPGRLRRYGR